MTLRQAFDSWLALRALAVKPSTVQTYRQSLATFLVWADGLRLRSIRPNHIADWMKHAKAEGLLNQVVTARLHLLRGFFDWAVAEGFTKANPVQFDRLPRLGAEKSPKAAITAGQYTRILEYSSGFWHPACVIAWHTGLRMSDIANLAWSAIHFGERTLTVRPMKRSRAGQELTIPLAAEVFDLLLTLWNGRLAENQGKSEVLPEMRARYTFDRASLSGEFARICAKAGVPGSFHSLRHGFVTRLINAGADLVTISQMTGQSIKVLAQYAHVSTDAKRTALEKANGTAGTPEMPQTALAAGGRASFQEGAV